MDNGEEGVRSEKSMATACILLSFLTVRLLRTRESAKCLGATEIMCVYVTVLVVYVGIGVCVRVCVPLRVHHRRVSLQHVVLMSR